MTPLDARRADARCGRSPLRRSVQPRRGACFTRRQRVDGRRLTSGDAAYGPSPTAPAAGAAAAISHLSAPGAAHVDDPPVITPPTITTHHHEAGPTAADPVPHAPGPHGPYRQCDPNAPPVRWSEGQRIAEYRCPPTAEAGKAFTGGERPHTPSRVGLPQPHRGKTSLRPQTVSTCTGLRLITRARCFPGQDSVHSPTPAPGTRS